MKRLITAIAMSIAALSVAPAYADKAPIYTKAFSKLGADGYDVVSFFEAGEPVKGDKSYSAQHLGADFLFSSPENLDKFTSSPEAYLPQYGGYCAWAMADGKFAKGDPKYWSIIDGKLYLNYNKSIKSKWEADIEGFIRAADEQWPAVLNK